MKLIRCGVTSRCQATNDEGRHWIDGAEQYENSRSTLTNNRLSVWIINGVRYGIPFNFDNARILMNYEAWIWRIAVSVCMLYFNVIIHYFIRLANKSTPLIGFIHTGAKFTAKRIIPNLFFTILDTRTK